MSAANSGCQTCACPDPVITEIPGVEGEQGAAGADGTNGVNAYTITTANFTVPALGDTVTVAVANTSWMATGQNVFIAGAGYFAVTTISSSVSLILTYLADYPENTNTGAIIAAPAQVSAAGVMPALATPLPTVITDNSTGTASNTIAAGAGIQTLSFYIDAATIANGDLLTDYIPGYAFKILKFDARCAKAVTTGAKQATLNLEIGSTNLTGGVISLSGTYALGAAQNGSAVTANNTGTNADSFSIEASSVTAFVEGSFWLIISIQNMDTANAVASLADHVNDLIGALA